jgi:hypothetical protein
LAQKFIDHSFEIVYLFKLISSQRILNISEEEEEAEAEEEVIWTDIQTI